MVLTSLSMGQNPAKSKHVVLRLSYKAPNSSLMVAYFARGTTSRALLCPATTRRSPACLYLTAPAPFRAMSPGLSRFCFALQWPIWQWDLSRATCVH